MENPCSITPLSKIFILHGVCSHLQLLWTLSLVVYAVLPPVPALLLCQQLPSNLITIVHVSYKWQIMIFWDTYDSKVQGQSMHFKNVTKYRQARLLSRCVNLLLAMVNLCSELTVFDVLMQGWATLNSESSEKVWKSKYDLFTNRSKCK